MMAENIRDGLVIVENDRVVFTNRRISEISGYPDDELAEMGLSATIVENGLHGFADEEMLSQSEKERIEETIRNVRPGSEVPAEFKVWIKRKDGALRYVQGKVTAAQHDDITSTYITIADITDFAEREKTLRQRIDALQELLQ